MDEFIYTEHVQWEKMAGAADPHCLEGDRGREWTDEIEWLEGQEENPACTKQSMEDKGHGH